MTRNDPSIPAPQAHASSSSKATEAPPSAPQPAAVLAELDAQLERWRRQVSSEADDARASIRTLARIESELVHGPAAEFTEHSAGSESGGQYERLLVSFVRWRDRLAPESGAREGAEARYTDALTSELDRFERRVAEALADGAPAPLFELLEEALSLELGPLAQAERGRGLRTRLRKLRADLRDGLQAAVKSRGASPAERDRWAAFLRDSAEETLTGIDTLSPRRAASRLGKVAAEHSWFLREIETERGRRRARIDRSLRRLRAEAQERTLQDRLEDHFGTRSVARAERVMLACVFLVLGLFLVEALFEFSERTLTALHIADTALCAMFLIEFFVKLKFVPGRGRWFARHFVVDFIPSIPFALLLGGPSADPARAGRLLRLLRLPRVARYMRLMLPLLRLLRALGFLARGLDRIVRSYRGVLDFSVVLTPTQRERELSHRETTGPAARARALNADLEEAWETLAASVDAERRQDVIEARIGLIGHALEGWEAAEDATSAAGKRIRAERAQADLTAEAWIYRLQTARAAEIEQALDPELLERLTRAARLFARAPLIWLPLVRRIIPRLAPEQRPAEVLEAVAHRIGDELDKHLDRIFFVTDLFGTITPSEFVDRVGAALIKGSSRPAFRLMIFGSFFLLVQLALSVLGNDSELLLSIYGFLELVVGTTLLVLGGICLVLLSLGWWLRRLARDATSFFEQTAAAQFLALTSGARTRALERDVGLLTERVLSSEAKLAAASAGLPDPAGAGAHDPSAQAAPVRHDNAELHADLSRRVRTWLARGGRSTETGVELPALERVALLYRHDLAGALFGESDTHTTSQLLGSPALVELRAQSHRVDKRERKTLRALDLEASQGGLRGPYLWFSLIARAAARSAARLIIDYNRHAIPLSELPQASAEERARHATWLAHRAPASQRPQSPAPGADEPPQVTAPGERTLTSAFTALHFLDDDEQRDIDVRDRFGPEVLASLQRDRRGLFRTLLGTYPLHARPRSERLFNVSRTYDDWIAGGRVFLLPLRIAGLMLGGLVQLVRLTIRAARDIRRPGLRRLESTGEPLFSADFATAVRKLDRMRVPTVRASLWARARFDPEYLGLSFAGLEAYAPDAGNVDADLAFIGSEAGLSRRVDIERRRAQADLRRLDKLLDEGLLERVAALLGARPEELGPAHRRALVVAYRGDLDGIRSLLSCRDLIDELLANAPREAWRSVTWPRPKLRRLLREFDASAAQTAAPDSGSTQASRATGSSIAAGPHPETPAADPTDPLGGTDSDAVATARWRAVRENRHGVAKLLEQHATLGAAGAREAGERRLAEVLRHPGRVGEQLVTLRTVQTLSLIDLLQYREHVFRLGGFEADGDSPGPSLSLAPSPRQPDPSAPEPA